MTILVVEDDYTLREIISDLLRELGHDVLVADSARQALSLLNDNIEGLALAICDYRLPDMHGYDLYLKIHEAHPSCRGIITSGYPKESLDETHQHPRIFFLQKPFSIDELVEQVTVPLQAVV